jgi:nitrate/TMAO reductase-like tetraheme cytochrome c subunit
VAVEAACGIRPPWKKFNQINALALICRKCHGWHASCNEQQHAVAAKVVASAAEPT